MAITLRSIGRETKELVRTLLLILPATVLLYSCSGAVSGSKEYPKVIQAMVVKGMEVKKTFPAASGMTGWLVTFNGKYTIVYTTEDEKTLIAGGLFDASGNDITDEYKKKYIPAPDYSAAYDVIDQSSYVVDGQQDSPRNIIYVFFDPNCPYCHQAWLALQPYQKIGLQVRWIPVAYLAPSSVSKAVKILDAQDKTTAFRKSMQNFKKNRRAPADIKAQDKPEIAKMLKSNSHLMSKFGVSATPAFVWKHQDGSVKVTLGLPKPNDLPMITGLSLPPG